MIITLDRDETIYLYDGEAMLIPADKNRLKNYLDKEFRREYASRSEKYNLFLERV